MPAFSFWFPRAVLLVATPFATLAAEFTPRAFIAALPKLPVTHGADCEWTELNARAEAAVSKAQMVAMAAMQSGAASMAVSDAQGAAIERVASERVSQCPMSFTADQMNVETKLEASRTRVSEMLGERQSARDACPLRDGFPEPGCIAHVDRDFLARVEAEVARVIGTDVQPNVARIDQGISACIADREAAAKAARDAGITSGPFASTVLSMPIMDWQLASSAMALHRRSCEYVQSALADFQIR